MATAEIDDNRERTILVVSNVDGETPVPVKVNPTTHAVIVEVA